MAVITTRFIIDKPERELYVTDISSHVNREIEKSNLKEGAVVVFIGGSTAAIGTIEYEPNLLIDLNRMLERIIPSDVEYEHSKTWGEENGKSHLRASIFGPSITIPFAQGKMLLGKWQQVVVMDFDTITRKREVIVQIIT